MTDTKTRHDPFGFDPAHVVDLRVEMASERDYLPADWPSEIVRRAARLMQERAYAATCGPWHAEPGSSGHGPDGKPWPANYVASAAGVPRFKTHTVEDAEHIAALDPIVADLIADAWLHQAYDMADHLAHLHAFGPPGNCVAEGYAQGGAS